METSVGKKLNSKRVTITSKRQFTIPQKFFSELRFDREAICSVDNGKLVLEPVVAVSGGEFSEQILADLIAEGMNGNELLKKFQSRQAKVRPAIETILEESKNTANGKSEYSTYKDVFGAQ